MERNLVAKELLKLAKILISTDEKMEKSLLDYLKEHPNADLRELHKAMGVKFPVKDLHQSPVCRALVDLRNTQKVDAQRSWNEGNPKFTLKASENKTAATPEFLSLTDDLSHDQLVKFVFECSIGKTIPTVRALRNWHKKQGLNSDL